MIESAITDIGRNWSATVRRENAKSGYEGWMILFDGSFHDRSRFEMNTAV